MKYIITILLLCLVIVLIIFSLCIFDEKYKVEYTNDISSFLISNGFEPITNIESITYYSNASDSFNQILKDIDNERNYVNISMYSIYDNEYAKRYSNCLIEAVKRGVHVQCITDSLGNHSKYVKLMKKNGVKVILFKPISNIKHYLSLRNHDKYTLVGNNILHVYSYVILTDSIKDWVEFGVRIKGDFSKLSLDKMITKSLISETYNDGLVSDGLVSSGLVSDGYSIEHSGGYSDRYSNKHSDGSVSDGLVSDRYSNKHSDRYGDRYNNKHSDGLVSDGSVSDGLVSSGYSIEHSGGYSDRYSNKHSDGLVSDDTSNDKHSDTFTTDTFTTDKHPTSNTIIITTDTNTTHLYIPFWSYWKSNYGLYVDVYLNTILNTKKELYIINPYFAPPDIILNAIIKTSQHSIIKVFVLSKGDHPIIGKDAVHIIHKLLSKVNKQNTFFYVYPKTHIHAKIMLSDDDTVILGSGNLDYRSLFQMHEMGLYVKDKSLYTIIKNQYDELSKECSLETGDYSAYDMLYNNIIGSNHIYKSLL